MNIQNIKNETIHKLTAREIGALDLLNHGVYTYKGELKSRKRGLETVVVSDWQVNFEGSVCVAEFIKIQQELDETEWAMRIRRKGIYPGEPDRYEEFVNILYGCEFFR